MPPEAKDVPGLMAVMVAGVHRAEKENLPAPLIAALVHYQFVTIHPSYDGNGRTARLLATFIVHRGGYGLSGFFSLEEHHARDLDAYYHSLAAHPHHNYYEGRAAADLTAWLEYFMNTLKDVFAAAQEEALSLAEQRVQTVPRDLQRLDHRARVILALFNHTDRITTHQVAKALGLSPRMARVLLHEWVDAGWLKIIDPSNRKRA